MTCFLCHAFLLSSRSYFNNSSCSLLKLRTAICFETNLFSDSFSFSFTKVCFTSIADFACWSYYPLLVTYFTFSLTLGVKWPFCLTKLRTSADRLCLLAVCNRMRLYIESRWDSFLIFALQIFELISSSLLAIFVS